MKLRKDEKFPITDPNMTRFNIELNDGVEFVLKCLDLMWGGEIFVPKLQSYKVKDIIKALSIDQKRINIIGSRPGEKMHEEMISKDNGKDTVDFKDYYVILPSFHEWDEKKFLNKSYKIKGDKCEDNFSYTSDKNTFLSVNDLKKLISKYKNDN